MGRTTRRADGPDQGLTAMGRTTRPGPEAYRECAGPPVALVSKAEVRKRCCHHHWRVLAKPTMVTNPTIQDITLRMDVKFCFFAELASSSSIDMLGPVCETVHCTLHKH